ncbi:MAG: spondin domain-containing protein [Gammaproteobacteria bacterium]|nr:spondin domain-containing protein [Gammaproteobacteria bacterium]
MIHTTRLSTMFLVAVALISTAAVADDDNRRVKTYEVTISNITKGQIFSPPVLVTHSRDVAVFALGEQALPELVLVAEDGMGGPLASLLSGVPQVAEAQATSAPILPGTSAVYAINSRSGFNVLSIVSMMVNTNDAFIAIDSEDLPRSRHSSRSYYAIGYDAGSEANNEDCAFVPGPACAMGSGNARSTAAAEGFVHVHNGVHGIADLDADGYDWRNPAAKITVKRVR